MKILKIFLLLCSLIFILNADDDHKYKHSYKNLDYLDLKENQVKEIKNILVDLKKEYEDFYKYKEDKEDLLEDLIKADVFDEEKYYKTLIDLKTKATKLEVERIKKIHNILNEKQRDKFSNYLEEWEIE